MLIIDAGFSMVENKISLGKSALFCCLWIIGILMFTFRQYCFVSIPVVIGFILFVRIRLRDKLVCFLVILISMSSMLIRESIVMESQILCEKFPDKSEITSEIISYTGFSGGTFRYKLRIRKIKDTESNIKAFMYSSEKLVPGQLVSVMGKISELPTARNPFSFNRRQYYRNKGILLQIRNAKISRILMQKYNYNFVVHNIREYLNKRIYYSFGENADFVKAVILGDKSGIEDYDEFMKAGTNHLLALSGLHLGLIAVILSSILSVFIRNRKRINTIIIILLTIYASVCGWSSSITRAYLMISLFLLSRIIVRKVHIHDVFFSSVLLILIVRPFELFMIGFQFSVSAVFALVFILPVAIQETGLNKLFASKDKLMKFLVGVISLIISSMIILVFHIPITYYHFSSVNFNGLLSNLISIPLFSVIVLPYTIVIMACPLFVSKMLLYGFEAVMHIFNQITIICSKLPFYITFISYSKVLFILLILLSTGFMCLYLVRRRLRSVIVWLMLVCYIPIVFTAVKLMPDSAEKAECDKISFFDVGSGDACLIEFRNGKNLIIDTGRKDFSGDIDYTMFPYMKHYGITHIDYLIITHAHDDHYGGYDELIKYCTVDTLITIQSVVDVIADEFPEICFPNTCLIEDTCSFRIEDSVLKIIHPDKGFTDENENNMSVVCILGVKGWKFMFTGDIEYEAEKHIVDKYGVMLKSDFLKVPHHGSGTSSSPGFLQCVKPAYGYISNGFRNRFGFPAKKVLYNLQQEGIKYFSGSQDGFMQVNVYEDSLTFATYVTRTISSLRKEHNENTDNSAGKDRGYSSIKKTD